MAEDVLALQDVLVQRAQDAGDAYLPGYTHLQRAQPVLLAHHLLAHGWALARDVDRLMDTVERCNVSPLGAGALAGSSLPLDPDFVAEQLGFSSRFENSLDAVSDRDFVAEALFDLALLGVHLSRIGEEIALWSSEEFGFCVLDDAYATGSSMLPQKKNPDVAELARGKAGRLIGHLTGLLVTLKGLPLAYNRDLQEDKEPLFDSVAQVEAALAALTGLLATVGWNHERMQAAADGPAAAAVDLAELLVEQGMPFRQAHALVGGLVRESLERHVPLVELVEAHPALGESAASLLEPGVAVTRRTSPGGAGPGPVAEQLQRFSRRLGVDRAAPGPAPGRAGGRAGGGPAGGQPRGVTGRPVERAALEADSLPGGPMAAQQAAGAGRPGRADRRGGGVPGRGRPRLPRLPGPDRRATPPCSGRRACSTCTSPTACTGAPTWSAVGRARPGAVLVRALAPVAGLDEMRAARPAARSDRALTNGPAKLCQALGVTGELDGADLVAGDRGIALADDGVGPPRRPGRGPRVGISAATERPWRLWVPGDHHVSAPVPDRLSVAPKGAGGGRAGGSRRRV